jgi:hypothetical protein
VSQKIQWRQGLASRAARLKQVKALKGSGLWNDLVFLTIPGGRKVASVQRKRTIVVNASGRGIEHLRFGLSVPLGSRLKNRTMARCAGRFL